MCSSGVTIRFAAVRGLMQMNVPGRCPLQAELFPFLPDLSLGTKRQGGTFLKSALSTLDWEVSDAQTCIRGRGGLFCTSNVCLFPIHSGRSGRSPSRRRP